MARSTGEKRPGRLAPTAASAVGVLLAATAAPLPALPAHAADTGRLPYSSTTSVGVHNAYQKDKYRYFADALDSGASLLELDVWTNAAGRGWRVAHGDPVGNDNNCEGAPSPGRLRTGPRDRSLAGCLADMRAWHDAHPGHRPILVKVELKDGFAARLGRGPAQFDALVAGALGDALYRPADLVGGHATLDEAVRAGGWPVRDALAGRFLVHLIPGTVEERNPLDPLWADREYALHLRGLAASGALGRAVAFPAVHRAEAGDPRSRYRDASIRPWFVVFDGDASAYVGGGVDTAWYAERNYLLVMTDAHAVAPAISATHPTEGQARDRVALLAAERASFATSDWFPLPSVLSTVLPRGGRS